MTKITTSINVALAKLLNISKSFGIKGTDLSLIDEGMEEVVQYAQIYLDVGRQSCKRVWYNVVST